VKPEGNASCRIVLLGRLERQLASQGRGEPGWGVGDTGMWEFYSICVVPTVMPGSCGVDTGIGTGAMGRFELLSRSCQLRTTLVSV